MFPYYLFWLLTEVHNKFPNLGATLRHCLLVTVAKDLVKEFLPTFDETLTSAADERVHIQ